MPFTDSGRVCRGLSFVNHCRIMSYIIDNICIPAAESLSATGEHTRTFLDFVALQSPLSQLSRTRLANSDKFSHSFPRCFTWAVAPSADSRAHLFGASSRASWCRLPRTIAEARVPAVRRPSPRRRVVQPALSRRTGAGQTMGDAIFSRDRWNDSWQ